MKKFLGWDCANRTLAWSYIEIDTHIYSKLSILSESVNELYVEFLGAEWLSRHKLGALTEMDRVALGALIQDPVFASRLLFILQTILYFTDNFLKYDSRGVVDILRGKKVNETSEIERTKALWSFLSTHADIAASKLSDTTTIIEHQPSKIGTKTNNKSSAVSHQLAFYYIEHNPIMIDPKLKNNISLADSLTLPKFLAEETRKRGTARDARYSARKIHSRENFLHILRVFDLEHILRGIPRAVLDDLADSTMQILAYLVENKQFI